MKCACIKGKNFDFVLTHIDCKTIHYQDLSVWQEDSNSETPLEYEIGFAIKGVPRRITVKTTGITEINTITLGLGDEKHVLPDGLICVTAKSCVNNYVRYRYNTCKLDCCVQELVSQMARRDDDDRAFMEVENVKRLIEMARHSAAMKLLDEAQDFYEAAKIEIENLNCNCKCL